MKIKSLALAAALALPFAAFAAGTTLTLTGVTEANKAEIVKAVKAATGATDVQLSGNTLTITGEHVDTAKATAALPHGVTATTTNAPAHK